MKIKGFLFAAALLASFSCDNMLDTGILGNEGQACDNLSISVLTTPPTKDLITSSYLPSTSEIGVFVTNSTGGDYDGHSYNNIQFTAEGSDANQKWTGASTIELSMNEGNCYAYYPYSTSVSDVTQIPVSTAGQVDYMYATPVTVNAGKKEASLKMKHALSAVRFMIKKGSYTGAGQVTAVSVQSSALGTSGTLNAKTGELTGVSGQGSTISVSKSLELSSATQDVDVIVVPTGTTADLTLSVTMDGKTYSTVVSGALVTKACCNQYTLTVNVGELALSGVEIGDWGYNDSGAPTITAGSYKVTFAGNYADIAFENSVSGSNVTIKALNVEGYPVKEVTTSGTATLSQTVSGMVRTITLAGIGSDVTVNFNGYTGPPAALADNWTGLADGVYAIRPDGKPADATLANELCSVAFVLKGKAYQVAKTDATGYGGSTYNVYWWYDYQDVSSLTDIKTVDGTASRTYGYLAGSSTPQLSKIPSEWTGGALADFNGQENTRLIIEAQGNGTTDKTLGKAVMDFRGNSTVNEGQTDWYAPACGQLAFMFLQKDKLNDLLSKVTGTQFSSSRYWSSSGYSSSVAWYVRFSDGVVNGNNKSLNGLLRLVRAI